MSSVPEGARFAVLSEEDMADLAVKKAEAARRLAQANQEEEKRRSQERAIADLIRRNPAVPSPEPAHPTGPGPFVPGAPVSFAPHPSSSFFQGPDAKRQKREEQLEPEEDWKKKYPGKLGIKVLVPEDAEYSKFNFNGQTIEMSGLPMTFTVKDVKERLEKQLWGLPPNKQKLSTPKLGFLKDACSLAHYNFVDGEILYVSTKERGGRNVKPLKK
eukprot:CAMPEP_0177708332 /NCGR_PEP_ID=MMETSP0484_2-20121128/10223_1 /TAXON_ID=354590 /ORGANISM="Rhodomonas lens, Strain RHODO" /LENGTH=214 /DNA_ID=CAMNT_0019219895 /DNA_START=83 /DNA_END=727 /DNA_ORIENTATION=+